MDSQVPPQEELISVAGIEMKVKFWGWGLLISSIINTSLFPFTFCTKGFRALGYKWVRVIDYTAYETLEFYRAQLAFRGLSPRGSSLEALKDRLRRNDIFEMDEKVYFARCVMEHAYMARVGNIQATFPQFNDFCPEIRLLVWGFAVPDKQVISVELVNTAVSQDDGTNIEYLALRRTTQYSALSRVNKESRCAWKEIKSMVFDQSPIGQPIPVRYHPTDVFLIWTRAPLRPPTDPIVNSTSCALFSPFTHIAIDSRHKYFGPGTERGFTNRHWLGFLSMFRNLKSHSIIYPVGGAEILGTPLELELVDRKKPIDRHRNDGRIAGVRSEMFLKYCWQEDLNERFGLN